MNTDKTEKEAKALMFIFVVVIIASVIAALNG